MQMVGHKTEAIYRRYAIVGATRSSVTRTSARRPTSSPQSRERVQRRAQSPRLQGDRPADATRNLAN